jgi:hypothetical protein
LLVEFAEAFHASKLGRERERGTSDGSIHERLARDGGDGADLL